MMIDNYENIIGAVKNNLRSATLNTISFNKKYKKLNDRFNNVFIGGVQEFSHYELLIYVSDKDKNSINHKLYINNEYKVVHERVRGKGEFSKYTTK